MSRKGTTGEARAWFVPTIASSTLAPTVAEVGAGQEITNFMPRNGFNAPKTHQPIDASDAGSRQDKTIPGNISASDLEIVGYRDSVSADDDFYTTLADDTAGYIVVRPFGGTAAVAAAQKVDVYKGYVSVRVKNAWGDEAQKVTVMFSVENRDEDLAILA